MNVVILEPENYSAKALELYSDLGRVTTGWDDAVRADVLVCRLAHYIGRDLLDRLPSVRYVVTPTTGLTHIDASVCADRGIEIFSLRDPAHTAFLESIAATSEHTFALILALTRRICESSMDVVERACWSRDSFKADELNALTLGLFGFGRIARHVARYAEAFGMRCIAHDPYVSPDVMAAFRVAPVDRPTLFSSSDVLSVHANLREDNHKTIGGSEIAAMKQGSYFVNTARGELVDEAALLDALERKRLRGAAVDVLSQEIEALERLSNHPLIEYARRRDNLIITPHTGGCTFQSMARTEEHLARHFVSVLKERGVA